MQQTLKFQKLNPLAKIPTRGTEYAAGYDLYLAEDLIIKNFEFTMAHFGVAVEIPEGYCGLLIERSSLHKKGLGLENSVGVIDSDYRGELMVPVNYCSTDEQEVNYFGNEVTDMRFFVAAGERIAQLVVVPCLMAEPEEVANLSHSERGPGGFGSTGVV